jgi:hypothetical protein
MEGGYSPEKEVGPQVGWGDYIKKVHNINGGEEWEGGHVAAFFEPVIKGVNLEGLLAKELGDKVNVKVMGESEGGFRIKIRGTMPTSKVERTYFISPNVDTSKPPEIVTELMELPGFMVNPTKFEDDYTSAKDAPRVKVLEEPRPIDVAEEQTLMNLLDKTAERSEKLGINKPEF